jgi:diaminopimelate epimerase
MILDFFKMHGQGNDYIFIDRTAVSYKGIKPEKLAVGLCKPHFGIGADGLVLISKSSKADVKMDMYNADGSKGKACGTAFRCLTNYIHMRTNKEIVSIETDIDVIKGFVPDVKKPFITSVNMGKPEFMDNNIFEIEGFSGKLVNIGNTHFVTFVDEFDDEKLEIFGPKIADNKSVSKDLNVSFTKMISKNRLRVWFWERGSGATLACGSGSCAAVYTAIKTKNSAKKVGVMVPGGELSVELKEKNMFLTGSVELTFSGTVKV